MGSRIFLVGYMGSGKSTIGKLLADALKLPFYDTDNLIEDKEGKSITSIFADDGEVYFRKAEKEILQDIAHNYDSGVFATGGGMPCFYNNMSVLQNLGITVYLSTGAQTIVHRIIKNKNRPLVRDKSRSQLLSYIKKHKATRIKFYNQSDVIVRSIGNPEGIVERIIRKLPQ